MADAGIVPPLPEPPPSGAPGKLDPDTARLDQSLRTVGSGSLISLIGSLAQILFTSAAYVLAVHRISVPAWGEFTLGVSVSGLLSLVGLLGLRQAVARSLAYETDPGERRAIIRWSLGVSLVAASALTLSVYFLAGALAGLFHNSALVPVFELMSVTVGVAIVSATLAGIFQGFKDAVPNALIVNGANAGLFVAFLIVLLDFHIEILGVVGAYVLASGVSLTLLVLYTCQKPPGHLRTDVPARPRPRSSLWRYTFAFWGSNNLAYLTAYADTLILGVFWPSTQVGYYSAAMTLARLRLFGTVALAFIFLPVSAGLIREGDDESLRRIYVTSTRWVLVVTVPFFLLFAFAPEKSMGFVWGHRYLAGAVALQILVVGSFLASMIGPVQSCLAGLGQARILLWTTLVSSLANVALSFGLIPEFGILGAAAAWGAARSLLPVLGLRAIWRMHRVSPFRKPLLVPLGLSLVIGGPVVFFASVYIATSWVVVPLFFFGAGVYVLSILLARALTRDDLILLAGVERFLGRPLPAVRQFLNRYIREPTTTSGASISH